MQDISIQNEKNTLHPAEYPPVAELFLMRPKVEQLLLRAFEKPLVTVIAGAGYGKTQAVLSALRSADCSSAWIQLSQLDNHDARFWERIAGAFKPQSKSLYNSLISLGYPESIASFDRFLRLITKSVGQKEPFVLIFDDFHLIHNKAILNFIELFVASCVSRISIVLISRKKPDLSLSGMLSKGLLARVTEDDLRFSKDEMETYYQMHNITFNDTAKSNIYSYTEGWVFAIYLVGLAAIKGNIHNQNPILPAKIDIFDLIEKEIFAEASEELRDFLIKISILDLIPSGLLRELADNNHHLISEMMQASMFVLYDPFSDSFRMHHLFKEFLQEKIARLTKPDVSKIHEKAAAWYSNNNEKLEAVYHYKEIGRYDEIFDIIISIPGRVPHETANEIVELIEQAPEKAIKARPIILIAKAGYMFNNNRLDEAKQLLSGLREEFEALPGTKENQAVLGEAYLLLGLIGIVESDYSFEELFKMADAYLPDGSSLVDHQTGIAEGVNACSINNPSAGELERYKDALFRAAPYASKAMNGCGYGLEYLNAAESSLYTGEWKEAEKYAYEAIYRSKQFKQFDIAYMANFVLVRIFTAKGNYEKATAVLDEMKTQLENLQHADCIVLYDMISGWFYTKLGKPNQVAKWIRHEEEARKMLAPVVIGWEYLVRSDCLMAEERYFELLAFVKQTDKIYKSRGMLFAIIQNTITKAIIHHYTGDHAKSIQFLTEAYELTHPNGLIMQFIEYGNKMRTLIHAARLNENCTVPIEWLDKIYTKSSSYAKMLSQVVSSHNAAHENDDSGNISLSKRESEVFTYLYQGMTRKEIASNCFLSLSTVNSVLKNVYDKLGASNAADAIRIAKENGVV